MFELFFLVGLLGFLAMAGLSSLHGNGHGHSHGGHSHAGLEGHGHAIGHGHAGAHGPALGQGHATGPGAVGHDAVGHHASGSHADTKLVSPEAASGKLAQDSGRSPAFLISPIDIFALSMGFGSTGLLLRGTMLVPFAIPVALLGAVFFNYGIIKPLMSFLLRFASKPSDGLEGSVGKAAEAITRFDDSGNGLIRLNLDDETAQLLAHLDQDELKRGIRVLKGDPVLIISVDALKNTCRVSREMAG